MQRLGAWMVALGAASGCTSGLESYDRAIDLRILAMTASVPEILLDAPGPLATDVTALVVDPRGGAITYTWSLCPVESKHACSDFDDQLSQAIPGDVALLRRLRTLTLSGTVAPPTDPNSPPAYTLPAFNPSRQAVAQYGSDITTDLFTYYTRISQLNEGLGVWPSAVLTIQSAHGDSLVAEKRLVLGVKDFALLAAPLAQRFGFTLCPTDAAPPPGCLPVPVPVANNNPVWDALEVSSTTRPGGIFTPLVQPLMLKVGGQARLRPSFTAASAEAYFTLRANLQTRLVEIQNAVEAPSVSWFCLDGDADGCFDSALTWPKFTKTLENVYTAPDVPGITYLWLVGRDQRGGEIWRSVQVQVTP